MRCFPSLTLTQSSARASERVPRLLSARLSGSLDSSPEVTSAAVKVPIEVSTPSLSRASRSLGSALTAAR